MFLHKISYIIISLKTLPIMSYYYLIIIKAIILIKLKLILNKISY
jgi:hypothetical protein